MGKRRKMTAPSPSGAGCIRWRPIETIMTGVHIFNGRGVWWGLHCLQGTKALEDNAYSVAWLAPPGAMILTFVVQFSTQHMSSCDVKSRAIIVGKIFTISPWWMVCPCNNGGLKSSDFVQHSRISPDVRHDHMFQYGPWRLVGNTPTADMGGCRGRDNGALTNCLSLC